MYTIRPFEPTDADYEAVVAVQNAAWPDEPTTVHDMKHNDSQRNPKHFRQRFVVANESHGIVAAGYCSDSPWSYVPGKYNLGFDVHPDFANQNLEAKIYEHLLNYIADREPKPTILRSHAREDKQDQMKFWQDRGYKIVQRENSSRLDVTDYDYSPYEGITEKVLASGIELLTFPELQARDADWMQKFYDLVNIIDHDIPAQDAPTPQPIEEFAKMFKHPSFLPDAQFLAVDGEQWVGMSTLWKDSVRTDRLWVGLTGVLRSHRRRGIATALKLKTFRYAQAQGVSFLDTENEENNPMYDLNVQFGFRPLPGWVEFRKELVENAK